MGKSLGTAVIGILFLAAGIFGMVITNSIAYLPSVESGYSGGTVLAAGFVSLFALLIGLVLLVWYLISQMY